MIYRIYFDSETSGSDCFTIEAETIEEVRRIAKIECEKRGWKEEDCWSECIEDDVPHKETTLLA